MDGIYFSSMKKKVGPRKSFLNSNIFRISLFLLISLIYFLFISSIIENFVSNIALNSIRESKIVTLNYLTPIYAQKIYTNEYTINTLVDSDITKGSISKTDIKTEDTRVIAMQKFLFDYNSPMYPYSKTFITEADKYGLDWRLVASISGVESAFGNLIPRGTHNAWGWRGINKNPEGWSQFESWNAAIAEVTRGLAQGYGTTLTPYQIEQYYCPPCWSNHAHAWANGVSRFMRELKYYSDNLN